MIKKEINIAVITGGKAFNVVEFNRLFKSFDGINSYIQHIDEFASAPVNERDMYDAVVFFFMMKENEPTDEGLPGYCGKPKAVIEHLCKTGQGIIILHHALLAYSKWPIWSNLVGISNRELLEYKHDEIIEINVEDKSHPITKDLENWEMVDETYLMANAGLESQLLLTANQKGSMDTIAWVRENNSNRVFCLKSGHDEKTWHNDNFRVALERGIRWSCNKL